MVRYSMSLYFGTEEDKQSLLLRLNNVKDNMSLSSYREVLLLLLDEYEGNTEEAASPHNLSDDDSSDDEEEPETEYSFNDSGFSPNTTVGFNDSLLSPSATPPDKDVPCMHSKDYENELADFLYGVSPVPSAKRLEDELVKASNPVKDNLNYILIDPRELQFCSDDNERLQFKLFVDTIFYIGKGKSSRPVDHLKDAKKALKEETKLDPKLDKIASIWSSGRGVIILPLHHYTRDEEAFSRECCMIDAIGVGVGNLTNERRGGMRGAVEDWSPDKRRRLGAYLLYKAFKINQIDKPPELLKNDI